MIVADPTGPPPERRQHGRVGRDTEQLVDAEGGIGLPYRAESLLARLERHGDIGQRERLAGEEFQRLFRLALFDPLHAADMGQQVRASVPQGAFDGERARRKVREALDALGGHGSPSGVCAWYVLGCEFSVHEWALRQGWSGKPLRREVAKGILISTLGILAKHFA